MYQIYFLLILFCICVCVYIYIKIEHCFWIKNIKKGNICSSFSHQETSGKELVSLRIINLFSKTTSNCISAYSPVEIYRFYYIRLLFNIRQRRHQVKSWEYGHIISIIDQQVVIICQITSNNNKWVSFVENLLCLHDKLLHLCSTLHDSTDCSPPGSFVCGILQARILEWIATPSSRGSSWLEDRTCVLCLLL